MLNLYPIHSLFFLMAIVSVGFLYTNHIMLGQLIHTTYYFLFWFCLFPDIRQAFVDVFGAAVLFHFVTCFVLLLVIRLSLLVYIITQQ